MFESEAKRFARAGGKNLPCRAAREAFRRYVYRVADDVGENCPDATFEKVLCQLGKTPEEAAENFLGGQPAKTVEDWKEKAKKEKRRLRIAIGAIIAILVAVVAFFVVTKGVLVINTETTIVDYGDTDLTLDEILDMEMNRMEAEHKGEMTSGS